MARNKDEPRTWDRVVMYASAAALVLLLAGLVAGLGIGRSALEASAARVIDPGRVEIHFEWPQGNEGGTWLPVSCREQLERVAYDAADSEPDLLSAAQLEAVGTALAQTGWYSLTPRVERVGAGQIAVRGRWRIPAANVVHKGAKYLISWDGKPMPPGVESVYSILEPGNGPPRDGAGERDYSRPWSGEDVASALELLGRVVEHPWASQVRAIDVREFGSQGLVIVTERGSRIVWGGRPSKPRVGEVTTAQKFEHLRQLVQDTRRIDAGYPLIYVNSERMQFDISASATGGAIGGAGSALPPEARGPRAAADEN